MSTPFEELLDAFEEAAIRYSDELDGRTRTYKQAVKDFQQTRHAVIAYVEALEEEKRHG